MSSVNVRKAVRGIVRNREGNVLLIEIKADPTKSNQRGFSTFWFTPGGKIEESESDQEALIREIQEETGLTEIEIRGHLFSSEEIATWGDVPMKLCHRYYEVYAKEDQLGAKNLMDDEKEIFISYKWWSLEEIQKTTEVIFPSNLMDIIEGNV